MSFPNEQTQFKPGESGNPSGRPKGSRNMSTILKELLEQDIEVVVDGEKQNIPYGEAIVRKLIKKADHGNLKAIKEIFDRVEGKAKQFIESNMIVMPEPKAPSVDRDELLKEVTSKLNEIDRQAENKE